MQKSKMSVEMEDDRKNRKPHQHEKGWECPECHLKRGSDLIDPCFKELLPGVRYACCGHGGRRKHGNKLSTIGGYIMFENGRVVRFTKLTENYDNDERWK